MNDEINAEQPAQGPAVTPEEKKYAELDIRRDIMEMQQTLAVFQEFLLWLNSHNDRYQVIEDISYMQPDVSPQNDPMKSIFNIGMAHPERLVTIMRRLQQSDMTMMARALRDTNHDIERVRGINQGQASMIRRLRKLVAPTKLKKFDAENKLMSGEDK